MTLPHLTTILLNSKVGISDVPALAEYLHKELFAIGSLEERRTKFYFRVAVFKDIYPREMLKEFCSYWLEISDNGRKFRFEKEKVFNTERRLKTWYEKSKSFNNGKQAKQDGLAELARESAQTILNING